MGWIVYSKPTGEQLMYYDTERKARARVTGHNKKLLWDRLKNTNERDSATEWAHCDWSSYEEIYQRYYAENKSYIIARGRWR